MWDLSKVTQLGDRRSWKSGFRDQAPGDIKELTSYSEPPSNYLYNVGDNNCLVFSQGSQVNLWEWPEETKLWESQEGCYDHLVNQSQLTAQMVACPSYPFHSQKMPITCVSQNNRPLGANVHSRAVPHEVSPPSRPTGPGRQHRSVPQRLQDRQCWVHSSSSVYCLCQLQALLPHLWMRNNNNTY